MIRELPFQMLTRRAFLRLGMMSLASVLLPPVSRVHRSALEGGQSLGIPPSPTVLFPPSAFTILVSEDDPVLTVLFRFILARPGFRVIEQPDERNVLECCQQQPISLIMSDMTKPYFDGLQLLKMIRMDPATQHIPFVFATARQDIDDIQTAFALGANAYLLKPFSPKTYISAAAAFLPVEQIQTPFKDNSQRPGTNSVLIIPDNASLIPHTMRSIHVSEWIALQRAEFVASWNSNKLNRTV